MTEAPRASRINPMNRDRLLKLRWFAAGAVAALLAVALLGGSGLRSAQDGKDKRPAPPETPAPASPADDGKLRIIAFGAHPDDCELKVAGAAARWAALGHHVKFVSVTNGDIGHWRMAGGPLAQRRTQEVKKCATILGIQTEVLDIHDGELLPTL